MTTQNNFHDPDYEIPKGDSKYMKFKEGESRIRILSKPIIGWEDWKDKKPFRYHMNEKPDKPFNLTKAIKHFWAMVVWNYNEEAIQILEITQYSIQKEIKALNDTEEWGIPFEYDIKITRKGTGFNDTEYTVMPVPKTEISQTIQEALRATPVNLDALFNDGDPFDVKEGEEIVTDLPF